MRYEILGGLRLRTGGRTSTVKPGNTEVVLATLLIRADQLVSVSQLADEVWGGDPPRSYLSAIHVHISHLRKLLAVPGRENSRIATRPTGYVLRLDANGDGDTVDVREFQQLVRDGRDAAREYRWEAASHAFEDALALWRGPALGELRGGPTVEGFATWAQEAWLECAGMHIDAGLALGRHRELIGRIASLAAEHPLHEGFQRQLMIALYRSERQSDALRVYRAARRTLSTELGIEPGRALREVHRAILSADQRLDLTAAAARPEPSAHHDTAAA